MILSTLEIGQAIRRKRRELGLSQERLAGLIGVTSQQVQRYEYGKTKLRLENLQAIAKALNVPMSYFFGQRIVDVYGRSVLPMEETERKIVEQFRKIRNDKVRDLVVKLLKYAAEATAAK